MCNQNRLDVFGIFLFYRKDLAMLMHKSFLQDGMIGSGAIGFLKESTENRNVKNEVIRR